ncbi:hypothetical protein NDU88_001565 [Pleurodeles waltl]|uniref:Uncharacterized protein n=1 Tax=Pleurodeles waltl TaxID=8319 RepID=A0AAV7VAN0_PLEWA|nr:hypothetical protein NDU88_001565 [Pleurodeles waltl]
MVPQMEAQPTASLTAPLYLHQAQECCGSRLRLLSGTPGAVPASMWQVALEDVTLDPAADHGRLRVSGELASWCGGMGGHRQTGKPMPTPPDLP